MKKLLIVIFLTTVFVGCTNETENSKAQFLVKEVPNNKPIKFKQDLVPNNELIHKGVFTPNLEEYYYTISDKNFEQFDVYAIKKKCNVV